MVKFAADRREGRTSGGIIRGITAPITIALLLSNRCDDRGGIEPLVAVALRLSRDDNARECTKIEVPVYPQAHVSLVSFALTSLPENTTDVP